MDAAMLAIAVVSALAAVAAAIFGFLQANTAIRARNDAQTAEGTAVAARDAAVQAQRDSADAADRIAAVMEQQAAAARAAAEVRKDPWSIRQGRYTRNGTAMQLLQVGDLIVEDVSIEVERAPSVLHFDPDPLPARFLPGDSVEIYFMRMMGDSSTSTLIVRWRWEDESEIHVTRGPLD